MSWAPKIARRPFVSLLEFDGNRILQIHVDSVDAIDDLLDFLAGGDRDALAAATTDLGTLLGRELGPADLDELAAEDVNDDKEDDYQIRSIIASPTVLNNNQVKPKDSLLIMTGIEKRMDLLVETAELHEITIGLGGSGETTRYRNTRTR